MVAWGREALRERIPPVQGPAVRDPRGRRSRASAAPSIPARGGWQGCAAGGGRARHPRARVYIYICTRCIIIRIAVAGEPPDAGLRVVGFAPRLGVTEERRRSARPFQPGLFNAQKPQSLSEVYRE